MSFKLVYGDQVPTKMNSVTLKFFEYVEEGDIKKASNTYRLNKKPILLLKKNKMYIDKMLEMPAA